MLIKLLIIPIIVFQYLSDRVYNFSLLKSVFLLYCINLAVVNHNIHFNNDNDDNNNNNKIIIIIVVIVIEYIAHLNKCCCL